MQAGDNTCVMIFIQCAMAMEAAPFVDQLEPGATRHIIGHADTHQQVFTRGTLRGHDVVVVESGIGLANAASATARALTFVEDPATALVVVAGTCGGLDEEAQVGDVIVGTSTVYSSADATEFGYAPGQIPQMPPKYTAGQHAAACAARVEGVRAGQVISADSFVTARTVHTVRTRFPAALATDMETAGVAQVCFGTRTSWISMRAVSALCGPQAGQDFHMDGDKAARISAAAVCELLDLIGGTQVYQAQ